MRKRKGKSAKEKDWLKELIEKNLTGHIEIPDKSMELADEVANLRDTLKDYENYKNYDAILAEADNRLQKAKKAYCRLKTNKRFEKFLAAELNRGILVGKHKSLTLEGLEAKLKSFEGFIDKKYWDADALFEIEYNLLFRVSSTVEEAIKVYERYHRD